MASLNETPNAVAFSNSMAAILAVRLFAPGNHIVTRADLLRRRTAFCSRTVSEPRDGITFTSVSFKSDGYRPRSSLIRPETKALYIETPVIVNVTRYQHTPLNWRTHARGTAHRGIIRFVALSARPALALGADMFITHSSCSTLSGLATLAGFAVVRDAALAARLRKVNRPSGANLAAL